MQLGILHAQQPEDGPEIVAGQFTDQTSHGKMFRR